MMGRKYNKKTRYSEHSNTARAGNKRKESEIKPVKLKMILLVVGNGRQWDFDKAKCC